MSPTHNNDALRRVRRICAAVAALFAVLSAGIAGAAGLNYVDANAFFNLTPTEAINFGGPGTANDNLWGSRTDFGAGISVYESGGTLEDSPGLVQRVSGLTPGVNYDFYAVFWTDKDENWGLRTGMSADNLTAYTYSSDLGNFRYAGSTKAITAGAAVWDSPPSPGLDGTIFTQRPGADPLIMLLGKAGSAVANASGEVDVYVDDLPPVSAGAQRSWFDGIAYVAANTTVALTATIDRNTGAVTVTNPTSTPFQIKSYAIHSVAGALSGPQWSKITGQSDGAGTGSFDSDLWNVTEPADPAAAPFATLLSEAEVAPNNNVGGTLAANGGTLNFGNIWTKSRFQDVRIELTLADDTLVAMFPDYTGPAIAAGDFNGDGQITVADYQRLVTNIHTDVSTLSLVETSVLGDMNGDRVINYSDFLAFRTAYEDANGVGAFAQMVAHVPEPSSMALLLAAGATAFQVARRRMKKVAGAAALTCLLATTASAAPLLSIDVDARAGDTNGPEGDNTVAGFSSLTLTPGTTGGLANSTANIGSYTITMTAVNAAGNPQGAFDDRDRAQPTTAPTLNQMYDDFIFVGTGVGATGGIDVTIDSGGALQPNKIYAFSLYSYDNGSTGVARSADWLDGNVGNSIALSTSFVAATLPTTDDQYKFTGYFKTDAAGKLFLRGRSTTPNTGTDGATINPGVFINGFQILEINDAPTLTLEVNTTTGAMRFVNDVTTSFDVSYYEIRSASGALNLGGWNSLDDAEGGDPVGTGWDEAAASNANLFSELNLTSAKTFAPGAFAPLGNGFSTGGATDLRFLFAAPGGALQQGIVNYVTGGGGSNADYDNNGVVDGADFLLWQRQFGTTVPPGTGADGSGNGQVDAADLTLWKSQFGTTPATVASAAVPEPIGCSLAAMALGGLALRARRRS